VIPESLHVCASPLAIVMTEAPGRSLYNWTKAGDGLTPDLLSEIAAAAVGAMGALWTRGEIHGDFALQNMLCDASNKTLAFIDFGAKGSCPPCDGEGVNWPPAVSDLAHLVIDVGADVRRSIGNRNARRLRRSFASSALSTYLLSIGSLKERQSALGAISDCARAHVDVLFDLSWSPQGLWRRYVKFVTVRRMTALLAAAKALIDECENRLLRDGGATREIPAPPEMGL
jgi:serine/threonine protein kinase